MFWGMKLKYNLENKKYSTLIFLKTFKKPDIGNRVHISLCNNFSP